MPIIPALKKLTQKDFKFHNSLDYILNLSLPGSVHLQQTGSCQFCPPYLWPTLLLAMALLPELSPYLLYEAGFQRPGP
jgi:hypothetical protein